jgi:hypothetical protein
MRNAESRSGPARGINRWRARCAERRTPGSEGGCTEKARIHMEYGTSPCSPPYVRHEVHCCIARAAGRDERRCLWI